ncbi:MAG: glycosyltransferase [Chloroflexota bacterium]|nr:glycosyltransferase [Chloroflexota bacterium]
MPEISVILPARNEERLLPAALNSVASQSYPVAEVEAIVVSNGSSDRTVALAREVGASLTTVGGPVVRVGETAEHGVSRAKNAGAAEARGRLLLFMDADSRMSPGLLARVAARASAGERAASIRIVADGRDPIDRAFFWVLENGKRLFRIRANMFWCERGLFQELGGFDETLQHAEDLDFLVRARRAGVRVGHVRDEWIGTSPRRLHRGPLRLGMIMVLGRWALGHIGIGRRWPYSGRGGEAP